jgi:hypothetical protein
MSFYFLIMHFFDCIYSALGADYYSFLLENLSTTNLCGSSQVVLCGLQCDLEFNTMVLFIRFLPSRQK